MRAKGLCLHLSKKKKKKRSFMLLEVVVALLLVAVVAIPLLGPSTWLLLAESKRAEGIRSEHALAEAHVRMVEKLYTNQIPYEDIFSGKSFTSEVTPPDPRNEIRTSFETKAKRPRNADEEPTQFKLIVKTGLYRKGSDAPLATRVGYYFLKKEPL